MSENMMGAVTPEELLAYQNRPEKTPRLQELKNRSSGYQTPIEDLAKDEDKFRVLLDGLPVDQKNIAADAASDKDLKRMEAEQAKWIDDMTGLKNKNAYLQEVPRFIRMEHRRYRRHHREQAETMDQREAQVKSQVPHCSILMLDFDHFKSVNDTYGHLAGDQALQQMAVIIQEAVRKTDSVYRYGGEEFVVFLPDTASLGVAQLADKIRAKIESSMIHITDKDGVPVSLKKTVSIGCVSTDNLSDWDSMEDERAEEFSEQIVKKADIALYLSKTTGRNRVTEYVEGMQREERGK